MGYFKYLCMCVSVCMGATLRACICAIIYSVYIYIFAMTVM